MKRALVIPLLSAGVIACLGLAGYLAFRDYAHASFSYEVEVQFTSGPPSDDELLQWLSQQKGVSNVVGERHNNGLRINFIQVRSLSGKPTVPDIESKCKGIGYADVAIKSH